MKDNKEFDKWFEGVNKKASFKLAFNKGVIESSLSGNKIIIEYMFSKVLQESPDLLEIISDVVLGIKLDEVGEELKNHGAPQSTLDALQELKNKLHLGKHTHEKGEDKEEPPPRKEKEKEKVIN